MNPQEQIDQHLKNFPDWRGELLTQLRKLIHQADPKIVEDWKWDTPIFTHSTMICALGGFKDHVKLNFFKGSSLKDPKKLLNAGFDSKNHRAIDFHQGDKINESDLKELIQEATELNTKK